MNEITTYSRVSIVVLPKTTSLCSTNAVVSTSATLLTPQVCCPDTSYAVYTSISGDVSEEHEVTRGSMQIGKMLPDDEFKARIVPILSALFASSDPSIRASLLENIPQFAAHLTEQVVENNIFPQVRLLLPCISKNVRSHCSLVTWYAPCDVSECSDNACV